MNAIRINTNNEVSIIKITKDIRDDAARLLDTPKLEMSYVGNHDNPLMLRTDLVMISDADGLNKRLPINKIASDIIGTHSVVGDVIFVKENHLLVNTLAELDESEAKEMYIFLNLKFNLMEV